MTSGLAYNLRIVGVVWQRELLRLIRDRSQVFSAVSRTVLWLIVLGFGLGAALREVDGYSYAEYVLPGVVVLNVLFAGLHVAMSLVWDRHTGILREVLVSPAPLLPFTLGKLLGGATIAVLLGSIPLLVAPFVGVEFTVLKLLLTWLLMFALGLTMTGIGVFIATQLRTFESFGSVSNGLIMPLYFLSGSIFPLRGVIGGVGFLDIPSHLRLELSQLGVNTLGGGWVVQLPVWIRWLVYANPVSYYLDMLRRVLLRYGQLNP
ncbi:MAG TPA: ABC transporter permease, partial [Deinococcales bacterium]|nr:ABC transporter permease [Deinococcales bacterium]